MLSDFLSVLARPTILRNDDALSGAGWKAFGSILAMNVIGSGGG